MRNSALVLASSLVCWCLGAYCDPVTIPTGPFSEDAVLTNLTFASVEDFDAFASQCRQRCQVARSGIDSAVSNCRTILTISEQCAGSARTILEVSSEPTVNNAANQILHRTSSDYSNEVLNIPRTVGLATNKLSNASSQLSMVEESLDDVPTYNALVALSSTGAVEGGGCQCPDYTAILNSIDAGIDALNELLETLNTSITAIASDVHDIQYSVESIDTTISTIDGNISDIETVLGRIETNTYHAANTLFEIYEALTQDVLDAITSIENDLSSFLEYTFAQYWDAMEAHWDELMGITNQLLSALAVRRLNAWLKPDYGQLNEHFPLYNVGSFFSASPTQLWGFGNYNFRDWFEYEFSDSVLAFLGFRQAEDFVWEDGADLMSNFVTPYHSIIHNLYQSVDPEKLDWRAGLYDAWAPSLDGEPVPGMPTGSDVAACPVADSIIGLLYRIQYLLSYQSAFSPSNVVSDSIMQHVPPQLLTPVDGVKALDYDDGFVLTNSPYLGVFSRLHAVFQQWESSIPDATISDWVVADSDGVTLEFDTGGDTPLVIQSRPIVFNPPDEAAQAPFLFGIATFTSVVWYGLGAILALYITQFAFRIVWSCITFAIAASGGDFSAIVSVLNRLGSNLSGE